MSLRNRIGQNPAIAAVGVLIALAVGGYLQWGLIVSPPREVKPKLFYYTTDDGKTVFVDSLRPPTPFQKDGKDAVIAIMFTCDNDKTCFCGYLVKRAVVPATAPAAGNGPPGQTRVISYIKKPADTKWVPETDMREWAAVYTSMKCPPGTGELMKVTPAGMVVELRSGKGGAE